MNDAVTNDGLIAKEFQKYEKWCRKYTRVVTEDIEAGSTNKTQPTRSYGTVLSLVDKEINWWTAMLVNGDSHD